MVRALAVIALLTLGLGCSGNKVTLPPAPVYDTCFDVEDCDIAADLCEELTVEFAGMFFTNAICTLQCSSVGPRAAECPRGATTARLGSCYPSEAAGGIDDTPVCLEPCDTDADCLLGFRCLGATELCAGGEPCDIAEGDAICVPGPD